MCLCWHIKNNPLFGQIRHWRAAGTKRTMTLFLTHIRKHLGGAHAASTARLFAGALVVIALLAVTGAFHGAQAEDAGSDATQKAAEAVKNMLPEGTQPLPVPRFVTLAPDEVNLRTGPGIRYPIRLILRKQGLPVEVIREFDVWRQVRDKEGDEGWVHKSMLSGRRGVIVTGATQVVLRKPEDGARPVVRLEPGVIAALEICQGDWCEVSVGGYDGWIKRDAVWGVYPDEQFKD